MSDTKVTEYTLPVRARSTPGVLLRISGLFNRRYYNIINIVVAQTKDEQHSKITIVM